MKKKVLGMLIVTMTGMLIACSSESAPKETVGGAPTENVGTSSGGDESDTTETQTKGDNNDLDDLSDEYLLSLPETSADQFLYEELADGTISIYSYLGEYGEDKIVVVPAQIDGKDVTDIHFNLFSNTIFKAVVTGKNIVKIPNEGFCGAEIHKVFINGKTAKIGDSAFMNAKIKEVSFSDSVEEIGLSSFANCKIEMIKIPSTIKSIEDTAFTFSTIKEVYFEGGAVTVCNLAFGSCSKLERVYVPDCEITFEEGAFSKSNNVTIITPAGSKAEEFAKANGINVENN